MADGFFQILTRAINDVADHGFDSDARLQRWVVLLKAALLKKLGDESIIRNGLQRKYYDLYRTYVEKQGLLKLNRGLGEQNIYKVQGELRRELDRRVMASANLIKLNRERVVQQTIERFYSWGTSVPMGGVETIKKRETKDTIRKGLSGMPFVERRVSIDQGFKFISALNSIVATNNGAIAARWHSHWRQPNYDYREDHKERDEKIYLVRDSWAHQKGLVKPAECGFSDQITQPGEEVFCRCFFEYIYNLTDLPDDMLTQKGREVLAIAIQAVA